MSVRERISNAIQELREGRMIVLLDAPTRENEGDLIMPAETIDARSMNFMIKNGSGIVCLSLSAAYTNKLNLVKLKEVHAKSLQAPFTISIDAKENVTTGVSASDRVETIKQVIADDAKPDDFLTPGHLFPLEACDRGVLARNGHTEGSVDIVRLAGFKPAAAICELMNADGSMMRGEDVVKFAKEHALVTLTIDDIIQYRRLTEQLTEETVSTIIPIEQYGNFKVHGLRDIVTGAEHLILEKPCKSKRPLVRIHSMCTTGDIFASQRCDCHRELHHALELMQQEGGLLFYLSQEGRGIGLFNKIKAYALQDHGLDTVEANEHLGLPIDSREYSVVANALRTRGIKQIRLLTNNPIKAEALEQYEIDVKKQEVPLFLNDHNHRYLMTKQTKLNHTINWSE